MKGIKITTNILGERELRFTNSRGTFFTSTTDTADGPKYKILRKEPWYVTDACLDYGLPLGDRIEDRFDNLTQAYRFILDHYNEII